MNRDRKLAIRKPCQQYVGNAHISCLQWRCAYVLVLHTCEQILDVIAPLGESEKNLRKPSHGLTARVPWGQDTRRTSPLGWYMDTSYRFGCVTLSSSCGVKSIKEDSSLTPRVQGLELPVDGGGVKSLS